MLGLRTLVLVLLVSVPVALRAQPAAHVPTSCDAEEDFSTPNGKLDRFAEVLDAGGPVYILAVGSGTTVGETNGTPGTSFPYRMVDALRNALPNVTFELTVRGGRNMTAETMLPLLTEALHTHHFPLVLWQTATVEAVRGLRPDLLQGVLESGIDAVRDAGGDVVLIDPQFSRFLRANVDLDPYESVLEQVAALPGVTLFHRFDLMRSWASSGQIDLEKTRQPERESAVTLLNICLGKTLARFVMNGAGIPRQP